MSDNKNTNFVWAVFDSKDAAEEAAKSLKKWDKADKEIKLGAIGVLHMDGDKLKSKRMGTRSTGKGAMVGAIMGGLIALFAPATLLGGAAAGVLGGGAVGIFYRKGLGLSDEQKNNIKASLESGKGLLIVLTDDSEVEATTAKLAELGGVTESAQADEAAIDETDAAMAEAGVQAEIETATG